jgi:hypothetical protein
MKKNSPKFRGFSVGYVVFLTTILSLLFFLGINTASAANRITNISALDWFISNFVLLFLAITTVFLLLSIFFIYRRYRKYGLGPRIVSILYIDGFNLKSIGNILCIVGIIVVIISLFYPWYIVSYDVQSNINLEGIFESPLEGDLIHIDGINGFKATIPGSSEPLPIESMPIPFSLVIGISILFLVLATVGISRSSKLGRKYIWYGIKLLTPVIIILVGVVLVGMIFSNLMGGVSDYFDVKAVVDSVSSSPFGGNTVAPVSVSGVNVGLINLQWGLGLGAQLLLGSGIILLIAGVLEIIANAQFFATKMPMDGSVPPKMPVQQPPVVPHPPAALQPPPPQAITKIKFCPECGAKLEEKATFCGECGKKLK